MSKIICDVCGTSYAETATQCPICGCVRSADSVAVGNENPKTETSSNVNTYTYVKGGRFSKSNVKRRNNTSHTAPAAETPLENRVPSKKNKEDKGLVIAVCILLLAIVAVVIYIVVHLFSQSRPQDNVLPPNTSSQQTTVQDTTMLEIPCIGVSVNETTIELNKEGAAYLLNVALRPVDTTDYLTFYSSDDAVASVSADGKIVAVGSGEAYISINCGNATAECKVVCSFENATIETTAPADDPTVSAEELKLNREDFTLSKKGETWKLYAGSIPVKQITWTSDNEKVATIVDGVVTAVGKGNTMVHGEYNGVKVSCRVICAASVGNYSGDSGNITNPTTGKFTINKTDVSIKVGESFDLKLLDKDKNPVDVIWKVADKSVCSVSGNKVTGEEIGTTTITVEYDGETYTCTVRVRG